MIRRGWMHWTEFTDYPPGTPYATEWNHYCRIVCRLLTEGHEGRWVVIKGDAIISFWDTLAEAEAAGEVVKPVMLKRVLEWEPVIRFSLRVQGWHVSREALEAIDEQRRQQSAAEMSQ